MSFPTRSIPAALAALLVCAVPASASQVLEYRGHGRLVPEENPYLPPPTGPELAVPGGEQACPLPKSRATAARGPSVKGAIAAARRQGTITAAEASRYRASYSAARRARGRLGGRNRRELSSVVVVLEGIAARGQLTGGRMPALFLQLDRNREFWHGKPKFPIRTDQQPDPCTKPPSNSPAGARIVFTGSPIVFQYYPGQGLQLQALANFGMANGMITACRHDPATCDRPGIKQLLDEMVAIRSSRGSFITWEYWFYFGGGAPPWTSGLSSGTAIQVLARASEKSILDDKSYLRVAHSALGVFRARPPLGVRVRSGRGSYYLIYSFSPGLRVLNAFLQAITGLYDYAKVTKDSVARSLYKAGDRAAQSELHRYDTGRWSLYSQGGAESSLGYHRLVTGFLDDLCKRLHGKYCSYYTRFRGYLGDKPTVLYTGSAEGTVGKPLSLRYTVDKPACVTADVTDTSGQLVFRDRRKVARGEHRFKWTPAAPGSYVLTLEAVDQNKNATSPSFTVTVP
jgi:D-glucuronyl C5-epimerase C-terminus